MVLAPKRRRTLPPVSELLERRATCRGFARRPGDPPRSRLGPFGQRNPLEDAPLGAVTQRFISPRSCGIGPQRGGEIIRNEQGVWSVEQAPRAVGFRSLDRSQPGLLHPTIGHELLDLVLVDPGPHALGFPARRSARRHRNSSPELARCVRTRRRFGFRSDPRAHIDEVTGTVREQPQRRPGHAGGWSERTDTARHRDGREARSRCIRR